MHKINNTKHEKIELKYLPSFSDTDFFECLALSLFINIICNNIVRISFSIPS